MIMTPGMMAIAITAAAILVIAASLIYLCFFAVEQQSNVIVERFGKFARVATPGLNKKIPFIEQLRGKVNMRVQQLDVQVETKTKDNVFVKVVASVQYHILQEKIYAAFYKLENPEQQITAFVFDVVRARVPKMKLDDLFEKKDEIANAVKLELAETITDLGYGIIKALVTDIDPDSKVKAAMNEINEAERLRVAANERGEADKILKIKKAEAEAESLALQGQGIANQRKAILNGLQESIHKVQQNVRGASTEDVMNLVMMTQYFDTLKELGSGSKTNTILIPHSPTTVQDLTTQLRDSMITAQQVPHPEVTEADASPDSN